MAGFISASAEAPAGLSATSPWGEDLQKLTEAALRA